MSNNKQVPLSSISKIIQGGRHKKSGNDFVESGTSYPAFGAGGLNGYLGDFEFDADGIVLSSIGARCGKCFFVSGKWSSLANTQVIFPDESRVDIRYLWYQLNDEKSWHRSGSAQPFIKPSDVKSRLVYLPHLEEQKRIAAVLDKANSVRRKRQQAIDLTDQLLSSIFLDMFGDPLTNSKGLPTAKLSDVGEIITGNTPSRKKPEYYGDYIEWIKSDNINTPSHYLTKAEEYLSEEGLKVGRSVPENSILVTCIAGSKECIGNVAMADRKVAFNQQINAIVPNESISTLFLYAQICFNKKLVQRASTESMKGLVSKSKFSDIEIVLPKKEEQEKYVKIFLKAINEIKKMDGSKIKADELFNGLAHQAFRGGLSKSTKAA